MIRLVGTRVTRALYKEDAEYLSLLVHEYREC
jgi:hypothetical protein